VKEAKLARSVARSGGHELLATRFIGADGKVVLTCLLHGQEQGKYEPGAEAAWAALEAKYGGALVFDAL